MNMNEEVSNAIGKFCGSLADEKILIPEEKRESVTALIATFAMEMFKIGSRQAVEDVKKHIAGLVVEYGENK